MTYSEFFSSVKTRFMGTDVSDIQEHLAYQFNITGEGSGIFYVEVKDGQLYIEPYEYFDRDAVFIASVDVFEEILNGKMDPVMAYTLQKMMVEGNLDKALRLKDLIERK